jgi:hypothetical protein
MRRGKALQRYTELRRSALKSGVPEAQLQRGAGLARSPRKTRRKISEATRREVAERSRGRCIVCGGKRGRMTRHHVLPVQRWPELELVAANMVLACFDCHMAHEGASRRIRWSELPECAITLAYATSGAAAIYLERMYPR